MTNQEILEKEFDLFIDSSAADKLFENAHDALSALAKRAFYCGWERMWVRTNDLSAARETREETAE